MAKNKNKPVYAFIDASNLFYGGVKSLGWKIDYKKLAEYLKEKYCVSKIFYYAGVEIYDYPYSAASNRPIDIAGLLSLLKKKLRKNVKDLSEAKILILDRNIKKVEFFRKLEKFGYCLRLKPVKSYRQENGRIERKANCDVDMTFDLMRLMEQYSGAVVLSGDGDFCVVLKYLIKKGRKVVVLARGERTAKEIKQLMAGNFNDFYLLRRRIEFLG